MTTYASVLRVSALLLVGRHVAGATALPAGACSPPTYRIPQQAREEDHLAGTRVIITAVRGVLVLSGTVHRYSQKLRYEQIAWQTPDVREVENRIRVEPLMPVSDGDIRRQIVEILLASPRLHGAVTRIDVRRGSVRLAGTFHDPADVFFLTHRVAEVDGVVDLQIAAGFPV